MKPAAFVTRLAQLGAGAGPRELPALDAPEAWPAVLETSIRHRVAPLVWEALSAAPEGYVPEDVAAGFRLQALQGSATRLLCEAALAHLLETARGAGVPLVVLKGATLAHSVYPRPDLRVYHDLDVLCRAEDYARLRAALLASGHTAAPFRPVNPSDGTHEALPPKPSALESHSVRAFLDPTGDVEIEVHFDLLQLGLVDRHRDDLFREARTLDAGGVAVPVLAPEHQLLHVAVHAQRHCFSRLLWLVDLDLLVRRGLESLDWEKLARVARDEGVATVVRHALATARAALGTPAPPLPPRSLEERCLGACYRRLWPLRKIGEPEPHEHKRLLVFRPDTGYRRDVLYGLVLVGRRAEKLRALYRRRASALRGA